AVQAALGLDEVKVHARESPATTACENTTSVKAPEVLLSTCVNVPGLDPADVTVAPAAGIEIAISAKSFVMAEPLGGPTVNGLFSGFCVRQATRPTGVSGVGVAVGVGLGVGLAVGVGVGTVGGWVQVHVPVPEPLVMRPAH